MFEILGIKFYGYGFLIGLGIGLAMEIAERNRGDIQKDSLDKAMWWVVIFGVFGARIYHVIDFWSRYYSSDIIKVLYFWEGGLGIWGAIIGGLVGLLIFCYFNKLKFLKLLDVMVLGVPMAQAIGRIGNYINGELVGKNGEPLFAYEGVLNLVLFGGLLALSRKKRSPGFVSGIYLIGYGTIRVLLENLRPRESIWKLFGVPVALGVGVIAVVVGGSFIYLRKRS